MTADTLGVAAGIVLSLIFSYVPGAKEWFEKLPPNIKQTAMGVMLIAVSISIFGLSCVKVIDYVTCSQQGFYEFLKVLFFALVANTTTYTATKHLS